MARPRLIAHLDTSVLLIMLGIVSAARDDIRACNRIAADYLLRIAQPVMGETLAIAHRVLGGSPWQHIEPISRSIRRLHLAPDPFMPATNEVMQVANEMHVYAEEITGQDSLALAAALCDRSASKFYTTDAVLLGPMANKFSKEFARGGRRDGILKIVDLYG